MTLEREAPDRMTLKAVAMGSPDGLLAFGLGSGLVPRAPGTAGTVAAIPFAVFLRLLDPVWYWAALAFLFGAGVLVCGRVSRRLGVHDHGGIVWDEMVGYWLAVALVPLQWHWFALAFALFRLFDIFKPWPIRQLDRKAGGGFGIMIDDALAGLYTLIALLVLQAALG